MSVGIDAAKNAALAAASIVALSDENVACRLREFREKQSEEVVDANKQLHRKAIALVGSAELANMSNTI